MKKIFIVLSFFVSAQLAAQTSGQLDSIVKIKLAAPVLQQYVGTCQLVPNFAITITVEDGKLMAQATGQDKFEVFPEKEDLFFYKAVDAQIKFEKDANGKVTGLVVYQNGMELKGQKLSKQ